MTPTKQDKELRQKIQDIFNDCTSGWLITIKNFNGYERELGDMESEIIGDILDLITADRKRIKELGLEQAQEIYNSVQKEKVEKQKTVSENEKIREMLNDPEVIGKAVKGAIKAQRKMAGLESEEK